MKKEQRKGPATLLAVASGGGHWEQLMLLKPVLQNFDTHFAVTGIARSPAGMNRPVISLPEANRHDKFAAIRCFWEAIQLIRRLRPDVVVTTGALPGLIVLIVARLAGARTVWIDSAANSRQLSMSGRCARPFASLWLTQWEHLASEGGPVFRGRLI